MRSGNTPVPPLYGLLLHGVDFRPPTRQRKTAPGCLILQVLFEDHACPLDGKIVRSVILVEKGGVVVIPSVIVREDRAIVGVGVVDTVFLCKSPNGIFCASSQYLIRS